MKISILILAFQLSLVIGFSQSLPKQSRELDAYISQAAKDWEIPGMSVVVVKDGKVLLKKGYGVREVGKSAAVDEHTLFACASTTKAMTATCLGMLVDEGKVNWDDPVIKYLPDFQLYDPYVTRELKVRDLLTHNSGVGNADFLWTAMTIPSREIVKKLAMVEPSYSLRSSFIYQNIFYLVAGELIEAVSGKPWEVYLKEKIFVPLGMTRTVPMQKDLKDDNRSTPHYRVDSKIVPIENLSADAVGPAGSVWSCADDISKWVICMLDSSKYQSGRLLKPGTWVEMFKPQVVMPESEFYPTMRLTNPNWITYAFGWFQQDYRGRKINFHTGSLPGTMALHAQLPDAGIGYYFFGNLDHAELRHALMFKVFDVFALGGNRDWSKEVKNLYDALAADANKRRIEELKNHVPDTKPSAPLDQYAGKFVDPLHGWIAVEVKDNQLELNQNDRHRISAEHWHYDTFSTTYTSLPWSGKSFVRFILDNKGKVSALELSGTTYVREK